MKKVITVILVLVIAGCSALTSVVEDDRIIVAADEAVLAIRTADEFDAELADPVKVVLAELIKVLNTHRVEIDTLFSLVKVNVELTPDQARAFRILRGIVTVRVKALGGEVDPQYEPGWNNLKRFVSRLEENLNEPDSIRGQSL